MLLSARAEGVLFPEVRDVLLPTPGRRALSTSLPTTPGCGPRRSRPGSPTRAVGLSHPQLFGPSSTSDASAYRSMIMPFANGVVSTDRRRADHDLGVMPAEERSERWETDSTAFNHILRVLPCNRFIPVAVGTAIAPPHRSRRAELPHRAPTLGRDAEPHVWERMPNARRWQPAADQSSHPFHVSRLIRSGALHDA